MHTTRIGEMIYAVTRPCGTSLWALKRDADAIVKHTRTEVSVETVRAEKGMRVSVLGQPDQDVIFPRYA